MATFKRLIQGQNVRFDTHQAGDGQAINAEHLHLEKILHEGGGKIRFPMTGDFEPNYSSRVSNKQFESVRREVQRELKKNKERTTELGKAIVDVFRQYTSETVSIETLKTAAKKLAGYFGLDENFVKTVEEYANGQFLSFTSFHINPENEMLQEIKLSQKRVEIKKSKRKNRNYYQ